MTTAIAATGNRTTETAARPRRSLEELVDRVIETLFPAQTEEAKASARRSIHEARRLRQAGDVDGALEALGSVSVTKATPSEVRWAFSGWKALVKRRFGDREVLVYTPRHREGGRTGSPQRRDAGGRCCPGDAVAARQACLRAQPAGSAAPRIKYGAGFGEGVPLTRLLSPLSSRIGGTADPAPPGKTRRPLPLLAWDWGAVG